MTWKGWPGKSTARRRLLDDLYWGDDPRKVEEGHYHAPFISSGVTNPIATFRDAHVGDERADEHVREFVGGWKQWRIRGSSVEARRTNAFRVRDHTEFIPRRIAFWERPQRRDRNSSAIRPGSVG